MGVGPTEGEAILSVATVRTAGVRRRADQDLSDEDSGPARSSRRRTDGLDGTTRADIVSRPPERVKKRGRALGVGEVALLSSLVSVWDGSEEKGPGKRVKVRDVGVLASQ